MQGRLVALVTILLLVPVAPAQEEGASLREIKVKEILARCKGASIQAIWGYGDELASLGAPAKRAIQREIKGASNEGKLAGLRALIELDSPTFAAEKLMDLALEDSVPLEHRLAALELVGLTEEIDVEEDLLELLIAFDPKIRIASARALWRLDSPRAHQAKTVLRQFLKSQDPDLQAQGALTLAEMGDGETPGVKSTLLRLRREPGLRGQLADALYRKLVLQSAIQMHDVRTERAAARNLSSGRWKHLDEIRRLLKQYYDIAESVDEEAMRSGAARGVLDLPDDPHTQFMNPAEYREFLHGSDGVDPSYGGIGAFIDTNVKDSFRILRPIFGGPAWRADLRGGDDIVAVNGKPTLGRSTAEIIKQVKGPAGTPVVLSIFRAGWAEAKEIKVIRAKIVLPTVFARMLPGKIGYVSVAQFAYETGKELQEAVEALETEGMKGLVIDLRDNPGGLLGAVKACLTPFLKKRELICTIKGRMYSVDKHYSAAADKSRPYPLSVLINGRSASGAELMSGVLQHYSTTSTIGAAENPYVDALLIGEATFGKGTVQHTMPLQTWDGEAFTDEARKNGLWDPGEEFTDVNANGRWDPDEPFVDEARRNRRWNDAEQWVDKNGNGHWDEGEDFTDENGDGVWNAAEPYVDANTNGQYDYGAAVKMTVARYYLPDGRNFTRKRVFENGEFVYKGGVVPDIKLEEDRMEISRLVELRDYQNKNVFSDYVKSRWAEHKKTFHALATYDGRDTQAYPDFDAFYESLNTRLSKQEVRRAIRIEVRREVSNEIGKEILGDLSDDNVLRRGVREILIRLNVDPETIPEYRELNAAAENK